MEIKTSREIVGRFNENFIASKLGMDKQLDSEKWVKFESLIDIFNMLGKMSRIDFIRNCSGNGKQAERIDSQYSEYYKALKRT